MKKDRYYNVLANHSLMSTRINQTSLSFFIYFSSLNLSGWKFRSTRFECLLKCKMIRYLNIYILLPEINRAPSPPPPPPPMKQITTYQKFPNLFKTLWKCNHHSLVCLLCILAQQFQSEWKQSTKANPCFIENQKSNQYHFAITFQVDNPV